MRDWEPEDPCPRCGYEKLELVQVPENEQDFPNQDEWRCPHCGWGPGRVPIA